MIKKYSKYLIIAITFTLISTISAQTSISGSSDFVSRYVWRGMDFGNSFSIQPSISISSGSFESGFWGSYPFTAAGYGSEELDLYLSYSIGNVSILFTDYYFPTSGGKYGNYDNPGSHTLEAGLSYGGSESFPISISIFSNFYNDDDNTIYFELGYSTEVKEIAVDLFVGGTPGGDSGYYGTTDFNLINIGVTASKNVKITDDFSIPMFSSYILNPYLEMSYLVFGTSLSM